jgi:hypothetical protein
MHGRRRRASVRTGGGGGSPRPRSPSGADARRDTVAVAAPLDTDEGAASLLSLGVAVSARWAEEEKEPERRDRFGARALWVALNRRGNQMLFAGCFKGFQVGPPVLRPQGLWLTVGPDRVEHPLLLSVSWAPASRKAPLGKRSCGPCGRRGEVLKSPSRLYKIFFSSVHGLSVVWHLHYIFNLKQLNSQVST